jgi:hypothetical protein
MAHFSHKKKKTGKNDEGCSNPKNEARNNEKRKEKRLTVMTMNYIGLFFSSSFFLIRVFKKCRFLKRSSSCERFSAFSPLSTSSFATPIVDGTLE